MKKVRINLNFSKEDIVIAKHIVNKLDEVIKNADSVITEPADKILDAELNLKISKNGLYFPNKDSQKK